MTLSAAGHFKSWVATLYVIHFEVNDLISISLLQIEVVWGRGYFWLNILLLIGGFVLIIEECYSRINDSKNLVSAHLVSENLQQVPVGKKQM